MARFSVAATVVVCGLALVFSAPALAAPPVVTSAPAISGDARVGTTLTASAAWTGTPNVTARWTWLRCAGPTCAVIDGANAASYVPVVADIGRTLSVRLRLTNRDGQVESTSAPTAPVVATDAPVPTPQPTATATPTPEATATPAPDATPTPVPASTPAPVAVAAAPLVLELSPFPVIRMKGELLAAGARVELVRVTGPRGASVRVDCRGRGCPRRTLEATAPLAHIRSFERVLPAGTILRLSVTMPGRIGKWTEFVIRRDRAPLRRDRCLRPGATTPTPCPVG